MSDRCILGRIWCIDGQLGPLTLLADNCSILYVPGDMGDQETMFATADWSEGLTYGGV